MQNQFYKVMNAYSDEELLAVYKDRFNYTSEAIEAMEIVIWERDLHDEVAEIAGEQLDEDTFSKNEIDTKFQLAEFGKVISDSDYARECLTDSIYLQRFVSPLHGYQGLNMLYMVLGLCGIVMSILLFSVEHLGEKYPTLLVISIVASLLMPLAIWRMAKNKSKLTIEKRINGNVIVLSGNKGQHEIPLPIRYECFWQWNALGRGMKQVKLYIFLYDDKNNSLVILNEPLPTLKSPPPYWDMLPDKIVPFDGSAFEYSNYGFQKPFLYRFEKILKGLHEG